MIITNSEIRRNVLEVLTDVQVQIEVVKKEAKILGCQPSEVKDYNGNWVMPSLLLVKTQALSTLIRLNESERNRRGGRTR